MTRIPGVLPAAGRARVPAVAAGRGLIRVLAGADPAPALRWRSPWQRFAVYGALTAATLVALGASLASVKGLTANIINWSVVGRASPARFRQVHAVHAVQAAGQVTPFQLHLRVPPPVSFPAPVGHTEIGVLSSPVITMVLAVLIALAVAAPLPLAGRYPLLGWRLAWLGLLLVPMAHVTWWGGWPWDPVQVVVLVVVFCVAGVRHQRPVLWWMWAITLIPWWLKAAPGAPGVVAGVVGSVALTGVAVAVDGVGSRRRAALLLADQAERAELEQARRAVLEERARIARELHDVVAHHMSLIAVRAETAPYRLAGLPGPVAAEFASLSGGAREALADMRRLLGVLRHDQPAELAPAPQLADLEQLIGTARRAGMGVALSQAVTPAAVPPPVGVCAYRIVQESLSNASRHAPGAEVTVTIAGDPAAITLHVANGPPAIPVIPGPAAVPASSHPRTRSQPRSQPRDQASSTPGGTGPGHGLAGMRERVALLGGSLSAGPSANGGFIVTATLPLEQAA